MVSSVGASVSVGVRHTTLITNMDLPPNVPGATVAPSVESVSTGVKNKTGSWVGVLPAVTVVSAISSAGVTVVTLSALIENSEKGPAVTEVRSRLSPGAACSSSSGNVVSTVVGVMVTSITLGVTSASVGVAVAHVCSGDSVGDVSPKRGALAVGTVAVTRGSLKPKGDVSNVVRATNISLGGSTKPVVVRATPNSANR